MSGAPLEGGPPPPPPPPPPVPCGTALLKAALERAPPGEQDGLRALLSCRRASFSEHLKWLLLNTPLPSLIQEGPQCGLVALWMAGALLHLPEAVSLEKIVQVALEKGYTAQGEMFSAANMASLAAEVFPCRVELLSGGLEGQNHQRILQHLGAGWPVLIPYDEDSNHEPCFRRGHKAHWAAVSGALLGLKSGLQLLTCQEDEEIPGLFHASPGILDLPLNAVAETYLLSKQGKSCRYQLWSYSQVHESNAQLIDFSPKRAADGKVYIVPAGGLQEGLCGKAVLLWPADPEHSQHQGADRASFGVRGNPPRNRAGFERELDKFTKEQFASHLAIRHRETEAFQSGAGDGRMPMAAGQQQEESSCPGLGVPRVAPASLCGKQEDGAPVF